MPDAQKPAARGNASSSAIKQRLDSACGAPQALTPDDVSPAPYRYCPRGRVTDTSVMRPKADAPLYSAQARLTTDALPAMPGIFDVGTTPGRSVRLFVSEHGHGDAALVAEVQAIAQGLCVLADITPARFDATFAQPDDAAGLARQTTLVHNRPRLAAQHDAWRQIDVEGLAASKPAHKR